MQTTEARPYLPNGYSWTECPRWHNGQFYFSDLYNARVMTASSATPAEVVVDLSDRDGIDGAPVVVTGTGFLPDGRLLINSMFERITLAWDGSRAEVYGDLRGLTDTPINDMVIDAAGRVYVSQLGFDMFAGAEPSDAPLLVIEPDRTARTLTEAGLLKGSNGMAISEDGCTFYVAETFASRITAFDRSDIGVLSNRRVFAELDSLPDGICADVDGAVWVGQPAAGRACRIVEGGEVERQVTVDQAKAGAPAACGLGGSDRKTLFICCGFEVIDAEKSRREALGSIWSARVPVSGGHCRP